jgi:DNA-binding SARP family transcriptional activator/tetratricopeptide (TPR) repeat protein
VGEQPLRYAVLGSVRVFDADREVRLHARLRLLLAVLLCRAGEVASIDELIDIVWAAEPPPTARKNLQVYMHQLRQALGGEVSLSFRGSGYALEVGRDEVDARRFEDVVASGQRLLAAGDIDRGRAALRDGLALWRGPAYVDVAKVQVVREEVTRLEERRLTALDERVEADLAAGGHAAVVVELSSLVAEYPWREGMVAQLMLALYRCGRQAEALRLFRETRRALVNELGIEPGPRLRQLEQAVLTNDPTLDQLAPPPGTGEPATAGGACTDPRRPVSAGAVPAELPADVPAFTGRAAELALLDTVLTGGRASAAGGPDRAAVDGPEPTAVVISAVSGTAGVGKTALAVRWAHRARGWFPDGQLYVNLRGYDPDQPMTTADALVRLLTSLGVAGQDIPVELDDRAASYRTRIADRRMLIVLDNASSVEQVRPLLPGTASCAVLVTSRDSLAGLVARHGAHRVDLDVLAPAEATALLRRLIGARVQAEPDAAATLADQCARLPLALRVAAELADSRPTASLAELVAELADRQRSLDRLDAGGDPRAGVRAVFSWSYRRLPPDAARAYRLLGLHPAASWDVHAAAALTGLPVAAAGRLLDQLVGVTLLHRAGAGRYGVHDLLREYARERVLAEDGETGQRAAVARLLDHYLDAVTVASAALHPYEWSAPAGSPPSRPPVSEPTTALAWLDAQREGLMAIIGFAAGHGWARHARELAAASWRYFQHGGFYPEALQIHRHALDSARASGDQAAEARALVNLGITQLRLGRHQDALASCRQAHERYAAAGDRAGQARALGTLGRVHDRMGRLEEALACNEQAGGLYRALGNLAGEMTAAGNLGLLQEQLGRYADALDSQRRSLALAREIGSAPGEAAALGNIGTIRLAAGRYAEARSHFQTALAITRTTGNRYGEAFALAGLGQVYSRLSRHDEALTHLRAALALAREHRDPDTECEIENRYGEALAVAGEVDGALAAHRHALAVATAGGVRAEQARANDRIAQLLHQAGRRDDARRHWTDALALYADLGVPAAEAVRNRLLA